MNKTETIEEYQIKYKKHPFSKNIKVSLKQEGQILVTMPILCPYKFARDFLLKNVWGINIYVETRTVDVHIRRLRKSLNEFGPDYIRTVRASGYSIDNQPEEVSEVSE